MEVFIPTLPIVLIEIAIGGILGGIIRPLGWVVSVVSIIGFVVSMYLLLDLNPNALDVLSTSEFSEKVTAIVITSVNFLLHTVFFETGAILVNKAKSSFSSTN